MRRLGLLVLLSQFVYLSLGACVLCLCAPPAGLTAAECCTRSVRAGEDCCAPQPARLAAHPQQTTPTDGAVILLAASGILWVADAARPMPAVAPLPFTSLTRPQVILRI